MKRKRLIMTSLRKIRSTRAEGKTMRRKRLLITAAGALFAVAIAGGVAWASIPGDGGVIQGCYDSGGNVKVVPALPCPRGYTAFAWNQQGLKGADGASGKDGANGTNGIDGVDGRDGTNGLAGPPGTAGVSGIEYVVAHGVATQGGMFGRFPLEARCSAGKKVLGGGFGSPNLFRALSNRLAVFSSEPSTDHGGWYIFVTNLVDLPADEPFDVWAICASA
jgi:Collagen triple helix repeat (20 copies)